ncbi:unnamed protein product, partial [Brachionus calyciflorus]
MDSKSVKDLISSLIETSKKKSLFNDFADLNSIDEETCKETTGFFKNEFEKINDYLGEMKDSSIRSKSQALAIYLFWLKTGLNQEAIKAHFRIENRTDISRFCEQTFSSDLDKKIQESEKVDGGEPSIPNSNDREKSKSTPLNSLPIALNIDFLLCDLNNYIKHVPSWGGRFVDSNTLTRIRLVNTCTIDYFLLGLWYASKIKTSFKSQLDLSNLEIKINVLVIIDLIEKNQWNKSKSIWITDVLKKTINHNRNYDLFGDKTENIDIHLQTQQIYESFINCSYATAVHSSTILMGNELEKEIEVNEDKYVLLFFEIFKQTHYLGVYNINNRLNFIDDLSPRSYKTTLPKLEA